MNDIIYKDRYTRVFADIQLPLNVYITGSRAVGEEREGRYASDIDILIITQDIKGAENAKMKIEQLYRLDSKLPQASFIFAISQVVCSNFYSGLIRRTNFSMPIRCDYKLDIKKEYTLFQLLNSLLQGVMYYLSKYYHSGLLVSCYKSLRSIFEIEFLLKNLKMPDDLRELLIYLKKTSPFEYIQFNRYINHFYKGIESCIGDLYEFTLVKFRDIIIEVQKCNMEIYYNSLRHLLSSYDTELILEKLHDFSKVFSMIQQENMGFIGGIKDYG